MLGKRAEIDAGRKIASNERCSLHFTRIDNSQAHSKLRLGALGFVVFVLLSISALADASYDIIVDESGEAIVLMNIDEPGAYEISLPSDVSDVKVKGALYFVEDTVLELSIVPGKEALILYKTNLLTGKEGEVWSFTLDVLVDTSTATLNLPKEARVVKTEPNVFIEDSEFKKIVWKDVTGAVSADFSYAGQDVALPEIGDFKGTDNTFLIYYTIIGSALLVLLVAVVAYFVGSRARKEEEGNSPKKSSAKHSPELVIEPREEKKDSQSQLNVVKTLSKNEALIVNTIIRNEGEMKRNELERATKIAKSSLASSLHNLEQKNIVEIDKTHTVHFVKLTEWFKGL